MFKKIVTIAVIVVVGGVLYYYFGGALKKNDKVASTDSASVLVFTSPPRETPDEGNATYKPLIDYLSQVTGKRIVYQRAETWGVYRTEMLAGKYDIVFDGPHFVDYRIQRLGHNVVAKLAEIHEFVIITRKDEKVGGVTDLVGKTFCTQSPPNLGALVALAQFKDAAQQPVLVPTKGWPDIYNGVAAGQCTAGILPLANLKKLDAAGATKILFQAKPMVNQGITVSARVTPEDREKIAAALIAPEASAPTAKLRARFNAGDSLLAANNGEYAGISEFLRQEWGFF